MKQVPILRTPPPRRSQKYVLEVTAQNLFAWATSTWEYMRPWREIIWLSLIENSVFADSKFRRQNLFILSLFRAKCIDHIWTKTTLFFTSFVLFCFSVRSRDSSVGIGARYGLDGPEIESRWGRDFPHLSRPALGPTQPPIQWVPGLSRAYSGRGMALITQPPSSAEVKERVELYLYSPSEPSWPVLGWTLPLHELRFSVVEIFLYHSVRLWFTR